jgi:hypothetical protein
MTEKVTLNLPDEVLQRAQVAANRTGRPFEDILTEWVARGSEIDVETLINPNLEYPIYTLLGNEAAAQVLRDALISHRANKENKQG